MTDQTPQIAVAGEQMERSIAEFQRSCIVHIAEEQGRANPDNALIAVLCDAVRCSRELAAHAADAARLQRQEQEIERLNRRLAEEHYAHGCTLAARDAIHADAQALRAQVETLTDERNMANEAAAQWRDALATAKAELSTLRGQLAQQGWQPIDQAGYRAGQETPK